MFHDVSILFMLYNMGKVCYNQIRIYGFEAKREKERFTVIFPRCRQNLKIGHFTLLFDKYGREMYARSFFALLTNNITSFWRWRCCSRCRFLNSLVLHRQTMLCSPTVPSGEMLRKCWTTSDLFTKLASLDKTQIHFIV